MKALLFKQFALALIALPLVFGGVAQASHFWRVEVSDPTVTDQLRNFNIEFTALSTDSSDRITVTLLENNQELSSIRTAPGGDSGVFNVTVAEDGVYSYEVLAASSVDGAAERSVATRTVRVSTPEDQITIITVDPDLTPEEEAALIEAGTPGAPATGTEAEGEITDEAAVTDDDDAVLGEQDQDQDEDENGEVLGADDADGETAALVRNVLIGLALLALAYYVFFRNRSNTEV